jgi:hypothetical protein
LGCEATVRRVAELVALGQTQSEAVSRIRFRSSDGRASRIAVPELLGHVSELAQFILGKVTAATALQSKNVFFHQSNGAARTDVTRFLERAAPGDQHLLRTWLQEMLKAHFRTETFNGRHYDAAVKAVGASKKVIVITHGTSRAQSEVFQLYPQHSKIFLVSDVEPLAAQIVANADLVLFSDGGETDLVTAATTIDLAGGECALCQTQTVAGLTRHTKRKRSLQFLVNADLSYYEHESNRVRLRQEAHRSEVQKALVEIQEELEMMMATIGYFSIDPVEPSTTVPLPHELKFDKEREVPGPARIQVQYQ